MLEELKLADDIEFYKSEKGSFMLSSEARGVHLSLNEGLFWHLQKFVEEFREKQEQIWDAEEDKRVLFLKKYGFLYTEQEKEEKKTTVAAEVFGRSLYHREFYVKKRSLLLVCLLWLLLAVSGGVFLINLRLAWGSSLYAEVINGYRTFDFENVLHIGGMAVFIFVSLLLHELGHVLFANNFGVFIKSFTFSLYMGVAPMAYVKYRNIYKVSGKKRSIIYAGGMLMNLMLANLSVLAVYLTEYWIFGALLIINIMMVINNIAAFYKTDTYFILCEVFHLGPLKYQMLQMISRLLNREMRMKEFLQNKKAVKIILLFMISCVGSVILLYNVALYMLKLFEPVENVRLMALMMLLIYYAWNMFGFIRRIKNRVYR